MLFQMLVLAMMMLWPTSGVNALVLDLIQEVQNAYIELNGSDGVPDYSHAGHTVIFANQVVMLLSQ